MIHRLVANSSAKRLSDSSSVKSPMLRYQREDVHILHIFGGGLWHERAQLRLNIQRSTWIKIKKWVRKSCADGGTIDYPTVTDC